MNSNRVTRLLLAIAGVGGGVLLTTFPASALTPSGSFSGSWDGTEPTQTGRINRNGVASDGTGSKPFPGTFIGGGTFLYELFPFFNNDVAGAIKIDAIISSGGTSTHLTVFSGTTYDPIFSNNAPNYLGDIGTSQSQAFSILAPANSPFLVVASTNVVGQNTGTFSFIATPVPFEFNPALGIGILGGTWLLRTALKKKPAVSSMPAPEKQAE
jgi:hypothetical protein